MVYKHDDDEDDEVVDDDDDDDDDDDLPNKSRAIFERHVNIFSFMVLQLQNSMSTWQNRSISAVRGISP